MWLFTHEIKDRLHDLSFDLADSRRFNSKNRVKVIVDIIVGFSLLRKLIDGCQVTRKTANHKMRLKRCNFMRVLASKINTESKHRVYHGDKLYVSRDESPATMKPRDVASMFVHSYYCSLTDKENGWNEFLVMSDRGYLKMLKAKETGSAAKEKTAYIVPVSAITEIFRIAVFDGPKTAREWAYAMQRLPRMIGRERRPPITSDEITIYKDVEDKQK